MGTKPIDPIQFEVMRSSLIQVTEEMAAALRRTAYSTNVKTRQDFSCAFFDSKCRTVSQAFTQPVHLGSFVELIPSSVRAYGEKNLRPGDMLVVNNPFGGGSHLNDITVLNSLDEIKKNNYHFINLGSVIQYVKDYKLILNSLIDTAPEYIFFTAQTFYEKRINKKEKIIVKQVNIHASQNHHFITIVLCSTDIT